MPNCFAYCYQLNGTHISNPLSLKQINNWQPKNGLLWLHLDYTKPEAQDWIQQADLPNAEKEALISHLANPHVNQTKDGFFLALRGINLSREDKIERMVSIRGYFTRHLIITSSDQDLAELKRISSHIEGGFGPTSVGSFILSLCDHLTSHKTEVINLLDDQLTSLEDQVQNSFDIDLRNNIAMIRRETVYLRRYVTPQRDAIAKLITIDTPLLSLPERQKIRELKEKMIHLIEDLAAIRERANFTQDELMNVQSTILNQRLYFLALIATIFMPLGFLTGLLGVNLGGIPGAHNHAAFFIFCVLMFVLIIVQLVIYHRKKWL